MYEYKIIDYFNKKNQEICNIKNSLCQLLDYLEESACAGIVPHENIEPLTKRLVNILRIFQEINERIDELCKLVEITSVDIDYVDICIAKEQKLLLFLQDIDWLDDELAAFINDCSYTFDHWSKQKWLDGDCGMNFRSLLNEYQYFTSSLKGEFISALEEDIHRKRYLFMSFVYGSPEIMKSEMIINDDMQTYPFIHSCRSISNDNVKYCLYCGKNITDQDSICPSCGKNIQATRDPDITCQFCRSCRKDIPLISAFCPYCGNQTRIVD